MMNSNYILLLFLFVFGFTIADAQDKKIKKNKITGTVTDIKNNPIKGAIIIIDSVKTKTITNKNGGYKIKINPRTKEVAVFVEKYGLLAKKYAGEKQISFIFREVDSLVTSLDDLIIKMGYRAEVNKTKDSYRTGTNYSDFENVYQILNRKFPYVTVKNEVIKIGRGPNTFSGDSTPLILIDGQRVSQQTFASLPTNDIAKIRVIRRGSEAANYGSLLAANGVILVTLKGGN